MMGILIAASGDTSGVWRHSWLAALWLLATALFASALAADPASSSVAALEARLSAAGQFEERLVPTGPSSADEDNALLQAIAAYRAQPAKDDLGVFVTFLQAYPRSPWRVALLADIGLLDFNYGYFSRALNVWSQAWTAGRKSTDPKVKALVDRVVGELLLMHARLGHADAIDALLADIGDRKLTGPATQALIGTQEGLWMMRHNPGVAYLCGPMALKNLLLTLGRPVTALKYLDDYRTGPHGTSLAEVSDLADTAKLEHELVYRSADQPIPIPSIVHWKLGHFAAIVGEQQGRYHVQDPTFGHDSWVAAGALNTETSGYYLAVGDQAGKPWRHVGLDEAAKVRGMGQTGMNAQNQTSQYAPCTCSATNNATGKTSSTELNSGASPNKMTHYLFTEMLASLRLQDNPVGYAPGRGPPVPVTLTYNQAEASQPANFTFSNVSPKWSMNWLAYMQDDPTLVGNKVSRIVGGGGSIPEPYSSSTSSFASEEPTGATLAYTAGANPSYTLGFPDGSTNVYGVSNGAVTYPRLLFLSKLTDRYGNALSFTYDSTFRLTAIVDATNRKTVFTYGNTSFPLQVTQVADPFGRKASFTYDSSGRLISITDVIGIVSSFTYDANSLVDALTTPYGTTHFSYGFLNGNTNSLYLQATDPLGQTERVEYVQNAPNVPFSDPASTVPAGIIAPFNEYLSDRDTYYWDKHAQAIAPENYLMARQRHWAHLASNTNVTSGVVESMKYPYENRIWFNYPGQPNGGLGTAQSGSLDSPSLMGRVLDDGSTQLSQFQYNALGNPTSTIDPVGRQSTMTYAANNTDLLTVQQKTSASGLSTIAQFGSYSNHLPQTYTDAAGQTYTLAYNSYGQLTKQTDPLGKTVTYAYDTYGNLSSVTNQNGVLAASYTRDTYGRVAKLTDSQGWSVSFTYDALDRVTQETFLDKTTRKYAYTTLDLASVTDRQGRVTHFTYDADRQLTSVTDPAGNKTQFAYWENGTLKALTDGDGHVTNWAYDIEARPTSKTYADGSVVTTAYAATNSRVASVTDALGQVKRFSYAQDDQLSGITYQNAVNPTPSVSFAYDPYFPRVTTMTDGSGTTQFAYVAPGQVGALHLLSEIGAAHDASVSYRYDALGRVTLRNVGLTPETYSYDPISRLVNHADDLGEFAITYLGQTPQVTNIAAADLSTALTYDTNTNDRRLISIANGPGTRTFTYTTTPEYDITGITEALGTTTKTWTDSYDLADRLHTASLSTGSSYTYTYDKAGNITGIKTATSTKAIAYNTLNQVKAFNAKAFAYDANGNLTQDDLRTYQWDAESRLVRIGFIGKPGVSETFRYDGRSHRVAETVTNGSVVTTMHYFWCGDTLCETRDASDRVIRRYFAEGEEAPAAGTSLYYGYDQNGSVRDLTSAQTGSVVGSLDYDPYGNAIAATGGATTDFRYGGLVADNPSGLSLANFRSYDPRVGRWTSRDPVEETGGLNLYAYVAGNPITHVDIIGHQMEEEPFLPPAARSPFPRYTPPRASIPETEIPPLSEETLQDRENLEELAQHFLEQLKGNTDEYYDELQECLENMYEAREAQEQESKAFAEAPFCSASDPRGYGPDTPVMKNPSPPTECSIILNDFFKH